MKNATQTHLSRLVKVFGTFSAVARYLGFTPRWMRHIRAEVISPQSAFKIRIAGSNLQLRALLRELRNAGVVMRSSSVLARQKPKAFVNGSLLRFCRPSAKQAATSCA